MYINSAIPVNTLQNSYRSIQMPAFVAIGALSGTGGRGYTSFGTLDSNVFTAHQVPAAKNMYVRAIGLDIFTATVGTSFAEFGYNDNNLGWNDGATPVNPVRLNSDSAGSFGSGDLQPRQARGHELILLARPFIIPTGKYAYAMLNGGAFDAIISLYYDEY